MLPRVSALVKKRVRKYNLPSLDVEDLVQEGLLAASYAVDTYTAARGNLDGYISTVVSNALAMVAAERLTQSRQPYKQVQDFDGTWRRVPIGHVELEHETAQDDQLEETMEVIEHRRELSDRVALFNNQLAELKLSKDAVTLFGIRLHTPSELWIMARNMNQGRMKLEANSVCRYLGWVMENGSTDKLRYQRAAREIREQLRCVLGIDDQTYEPLKARPIPADLYQPGKSRPLHLRRRVA